MKIYISTIGFEKFGNANNIWLASKLKEFTPDKIILLVNDEKKIQEHLKTNITSIKEWFPSVKIEEIKFNETIKDYRESLSKFILDNKNEDIAIDVTLGRKYMSIISTHLAIKNNIKRIYYTLYDESEKYSNNPITQIPITQLKLINLAENNEN
ncbi:MAG: hypothetical protein KKC75_04620 [Nanoarchaeota archaeon]|nr:hypothetical protein [Nanoarchaeota archaeon]MBU1005096.1 hypothetical protein [Nanoarchaeota archaeon]MBU1945884.1 hypothetical protein [Nanoarchaeota archaeon]